MEVNPATFVAHDSSSDSEASNLRPASAQSKTEQTNRKRKTYDNVTDVKDLKVTLGQLGSLAVASERMLRSALAESSSADGSLDALERRIQNVEKAVSNFESNLDAKPKQSTFGAVPEPFARSAPSQNLFIPETRPKGVWDRYEQLRAVPQLDLLDEFGYPENAPCRKRFSNPGFFMSEWVRMEEERLCKIAQDEMIARAQLLKDWQANSANGSSSKNLLSTLTTKASIHKMVSRANLRVASAGSSSINLSRSSSRAQIVTTKAEAAPAESSAVIETSTMQAEDTKVDGSVACQVVPSLKQVTPDAEQDEPSTGGVLESVNTSNHSEAGHAENRDTCVEKQPTLATKYQRMLDIGLSFEAVCHRMTQDGVDLPETLALAPASASISGPTRNDLSECGKTCRDDPRYVPFVKMLKVGLANGVVEHAITRAGLDPLVLFPETEVDKNTRKSPEAKLEQMQVDPKLAKFQRMLSMGLSKEAVTHAMARENIDPSELFGEIQLEVEKQDSDATNECPTSQTKDNNAGDILAAIRDGTSLKSATVEQDSKSEQSREEIGGSMLDILSAIKQKGVVLRKVQQPSAEDRAVKLREAKLTGVAAILSRRVEIIAQQENLDNDSDPEWSDDEE